MSLDLSVKIPERLTVSRFAKATRRSLTEMLMPFQEEPPMITIEERYHGIAVSHCSTQFFDGWNGLVYIGEAHLIELDTSDLMEDLDLCRDSPSSALSANIAVRRTGADPVNWLLGAAAAIGLAREADSTIVVESDGWVNHSEREPDAFPSDILAERRPVFLAAVEELKIDWYK